MAGRLREEEQQRAAEGTVQPGGAASSQAPLSAAVQLQKLCGKDKSVS